MKVSVIMNCYNSETYLKEAIDSVYAQIYQNWEIIFWDNQSSDNSAKIAKSYDKKLKYYCAEKYLTLGAGRNKALEKATGDVIAFLDCDDLWFPEKLETQITLFNHNPSINFIYSNYVSLTQETQKKKIAFSKPHPSGSVFKEAITTYPVGILTAIIRKNILTSLDHWFDPKLTLAEDYDFFMRIFLHHQVIYVHTPLALYRKHQQNGTTRYTNMFPDETIYTLKKLYPLTKQTKEKHLINNKIKEDQIKKGIRIYLLNLKIGTYIHYLITHKLVSFKSIYQTFRVGGSYAVRNIFKKMKL